MMMKQLVILANKYPNEFDPNINVFTQQTAWTFADLGYECVVVCPSAVNLNKTNRKLPLETVEMTEQGNNVRIVRPRYLSMGQRPGPLNKQRVSFTVSNYVGAANKALRDFSIDPALFFGEFLCPCGVAAAKLSKTTGVPRSSKVAKAFILAIGILATMRWPKSSTRYAESWLFHRTTGITCSMLELSSRSRS